MKMQTTFAVKEPMRIALLTGYIRGMKAKGHKGPLERRSENRMNAYMPISVAGCVGQANGATEHAITVNVSEGGMYFISARKFRPGDTITVALVEEEGVRGVRVEAEVVHTAPFRLAGAERGNDEVRGTGVWAPAGAEFFARVRDKCGNRDGGWRS